MALPILDGNQTTVTLATTVSGGAHYPNHIIASSVTISSLPAISGTVTIGSALPSGANRIGVVTIGGGTVTIGAGTAQIGSVTASISNFPATQVISGTVTANLGAFALLNTQGGIASDDGGVEPYYGVQLGYYDGDYKTVKPNQPLPIYGTVTANVTTKSWIDSGQGQRSTQFIAVGGFDGANDQIAPIPLTDGAEYVNVSGAVSVVNSVVVGSLPSISGTVTANNPNGTFTTRFGSVTTANTAQITTAVTNTSRKYLLAQNISTGTVTIGIGFSPTTTQGIQLTAGAGLTFDSFVPTGAVYWLGATTGAAYTILEG